MSYKIQFIGHFRIDVNLAFSQLATSAFYGLNPPRGESFI